MLTPVGLISIKVGTHVHVVVRMNCSIFDDPRFNLSAMVRIRGVTRMSCLGGHLAYM